MSQIHELLPRVARDIGAIGKDRRNQQQQFSFRGIDDIYDAAHGPLCAHGVAVTTCVSDVRVEERATKSGTIQYVTRLKLAVTFHAPDGSSLTTTTEGEASDMADKATNKAMSAAMKYAFLQTFTIPLAEQDDGDFHTPEPTTTRQTVQHVIVPGPSTEERVSKAVAAYTAATTMERVNKLDELAAPLKSDCTPDQIDRIDAARHDAGVRLVGFR